MCVFHLLTRSTWGSAAGIPWSLPIASRYKMFLQWEMFRIWRLCKGNSFTSMSIIRTIMFVSLVYLFVLLRRDGSLGTFALTFLFFLSSSFLSMTMTTLTIATRSSLSCSINHFWFTHSKLLLIIVQTWFSSLLCLSLSRSHAVPERLSALYLWWAWCLLFFCCWSNQQGRLLC